MNNGIPPERQEVPISTTRPGNTNYNSIRCMIKQGSTSRDSPNKNIMQAHNSNQNNRKSQNSLFTTNNANNVNIKAVKLNMYSAQKSQSSNYGMNKYQQPALRNLPKTPIMSKNDGRTVTRNKIQNTTSGNLPHAN